MNSILKIYKKIGTMLWGLRPPFLFTSQCRFIPTCSEYSYEAVKKHGIFRGTIKAIWRVFKCNPFVKLSLDEVK